MRGLADDVTARGCALGPAACRTLLVRTKNELRARLRLRRVGGQRASEGSPGSSREKREADPELAVFGERVRHFRQLAGLRQADLAEAAGVHTSYISEVERGYRNVSYRLILNIARSLGVEPRELM